MFLQVLYPSSSDPAVGHALKCQGVVTGIVAFVSIHFHRTHLVLGLGIKTSNFILPLCAIFQ